MISKKKKKKSMKKMNQMKNCVKINESCLKITWKTNESFLKRKMNQQINKSNVKMT